jgi:hypothetical protein
MVALSPYPDISKAGGHGFGGMSGSQYDLDTSSTRKRDKLNPLEC